MTESQVSLLRQLEDAHALVDRGDSAGARRMIRPVLEEDPSLARAHALMGLCHLIDDEESQARSSLRRALAIDETDDVALVGIGYLSQLRGDLPRAKTCYEAALAANPQSRAAQVRLETLEHARPPTPNAAHAANRKSTGPTDRLHSPTGTTSLPDSSRRIAEANRLVDEGRTDEAHSILESVLLEDPNNAHAHAVKSLCFLRVGSNQQALKHAERAMALDDNDPVAHLSMGMLSERAGQMESAVYHYRRTLHLDPSINAARVRLEKTQRSRLEAHPIAGKGPKQQLVRQAAPRSTQHGVQQSSLGHRLLLLPIRLLRFMILTALLLASLACLAFALWAGFDLVFNRESIDVEEAELFGSIAFALWIAIGLAFLGLRKLWP